MASRLPLSMLLSQALVAFTLEFDNEFEHRIPHHTTAGTAAATGRLWLVSQVMWENVLRHLGPDGVAVGLLHERSRTVSDSLAGLRRWGYVRVDPWSGTAGGGRASDKAVVRPTRAGRRAQEVWRPLGAEIEDRWRSRFGTERVDQLASALLTLAERSELPLPRYLPVIAATNNGKARPLILPTDRPVPDPDSDDPPDLSVLLARVLLAFTLDFEDESRISLPVSANTLRVLDASGVRIRDLPVRTGVSKEANAMAVGFLERLECVEEVADPNAARGRVVRLTPRGQRAQAKYGRILTVTEEQWRARFGSEALGVLRRTLEELVGARADGPGQLLLRGTEPYPDGWRAGVRRPETLPHYPMVLHRGGYPDGS